MQICRSHLPDMVVVRHGGNMDGFALTAGLRALPKPPHVILVAEMDDLPAWRGAIESGAAAYLPLHRMDEEFASALSRVDHAIRLTRLHRDTFARTERTARVFESLPVGALVVDSTGTVVSSNRSFTTLTGISAELARGTGLKALLGQITDEGFSFSRDLMDAVSRGSYWSGECRCYYSQTREGRASFTVAPLIPREEPPWILLTITDVSEATNSFNRLLTEKWAAHDLISGQIFTDSTELHKLNTMIIRNTLPPDDSSYTLKELIETSSGSDIPVSLSPALPDRFTGKAMPLGTVIKSLSRWARRNSESGSAALNVRIRQRNGSSWQIQFTMASGDSHVSENFYESADEHLLRQSSVENPSEVIGIGLASWLLSAMGASPLILKTSRGEGRQAGFSIWLAEDTSRESDSAATQQDESSFQSWRGLPLSDEQSGPFRVLLAEDSPLDQANIKNLLQRMEYQVVTVENGQEAVEECEHNDFDLILMDILMPVMDGFEAARLIREREGLSGRRTPIVALTSYSLKAVQEKCQRVGMNAYLPKPVSMANLRKALESLKQACFSSRCKEPPASESATVRKDILDKQRAIDFVEGDEALYQELIDLFKVHVPETAEELFEALRTSDMKTIEAASHKIKGMAANIGADRFAEVNRQLMEEARNSTLEDTALWLEKIRSEYDTIMQVLDTL